MDAELITGYMPNFRHLDDWREAFRHQHVTAAGSILRRVIWERAENRDYRLLVDVAECRTSKEAELRMSATLLDSNVRFVADETRVERGALVHPKEKPRSVYFLRANLMIWVLSSSTEDCDVLTCADSIAADLDSPTPLEADEDLVLSRQDDSRESPGAILLSVAPRWEPGEWAWYRFTAQGGTLTRAAVGDRLMLWPVSGDHDVKVSGWAMEPGRRTHRGQYIHRR